MRLLICPFSCVYMRIIFYGGQLYIYKSLLLNDLLSISKSIEIKEKVRVGKLSRGGGGGGGGILND